MSTQQPIVPRPDIHGNVGARIGAIVALLLVVACTLTPQATTGAVSFHASWCLACGFQAVPDAVMNLALFVPLGFFLAAAGVTSTWTVLTCVTLSGAIEIAQSRGFPVGRYATLLDVVSNSTGAIVGLLFFRARRTLCMPSLHEARALAVSWIAFAAFVIALFSWALSPIDPLDVNAAAPVLSARTTVPGYGWYHGSIVSCTVSGHEFGPRASGPIMLQTAWRSSSSTVTVRGKDERRSLIPILFEHDANRAAPHLMLGQRGNDVVLRTTRRGDRFGLRTPELVVRDVFVRSVPGSDSSTTTFEAQVTSTTLAIRTRGNGNERVDSMRLSPTYGWSVVFTKLPVFRLWRHFFTAVWLAALIAPAWYWTATAAGVAQSRSAARLRTLLVAFISLGVCHALVFSAVPAGFGVAQMAATDWGMSVVSAILGVTIAKRVSSNDVRVPAAD